MKEQPALPHPHPSGSAAPPTPAISPPRSRLVRPLPHSLDGCWEDVGRGLPGSTLRSTGAQRTVLPPLCVGAGAADRHRRRGRVCSFASRPFPGNAITLGSLILEGHPPEGLASQLHRVPLFLTWRFTLGSFLFPRPAPPLPRPGDPFPLSGCRLTYPAPLGVSASFQSQTRWSPVSMRREGRGWGAEAGLGRALNTRLQGLLGPDPVGGGATFLHDSWEREGNIWYQQLSHSWCLG